MGDASQAYRVYIGELAMLSVMSCAITPVMASWRQASVTIVLAMATLGDATQIGLFLFMSLRPKWPRQVNNDYRLRYRVTFASVNVLDVYEHKSQGVLFPVSTGMVLIF